MTSGIGRVANRRPSLTVYKSAIKTDVMLQSLAGARGPFSMKILFYYFLFEKGNLPERVICGFIKNKL